MTGEGLSPAARALLDAAREGMRPDAAAVSRMKLEVVSSASATATTAIAIKLSIVAVVATLAAGAAIYGNRSRAVTPPRIDLKPWPSENNTAGCLVGIHSGPDTHDHPQVIIHAPNDPFGHTDEMWGEHGFGCNCLMGDGSVRFFTTFIRPNTWVALSTRDGGEVVDGDY